MGTPNKIVKPDPKDPYLDLILNVHPLPPDPLAREPRAMAAWRSLGGDKRVGRRGDEGACVDPSRPTSVGVRNATGHFGRVGCGCCGICSPNGRSASNAFAKELGISQSALSDTLNGKHSRLSVPASPTFRA